MSVTKQLRSPAVFLLGFLAGVGATVLFLRRQSKQIPERLTPYEREPAQVREPVLIINRWSGDGRAERVGLADAAAAAGVRTVMLERGDDLKQLAHDAISGGADAIGMAGGDGSLGLVAGVAIERDVPFFCIPVGTRNHFALDLGLDRDNPVSALAALSSGDEIRIDHGVVGGRVFLNNVSFGVYAQAVHHEEYRENKEATLRQVLMEAAADPEKQAPISYVTPDGGEYDRVPLLLVANNPYVLTGPPDFGRRTRLDKGVLGVGAVTDLPRGQRITVPDLVASGALQEWDTPSLRLTSPDPIQAGVDGEALTFDSPLTLSIQPKALRVLVPRGTTPGYVTKGERAAAHIVDLAELGIGDT